MVEPQRIGHLTCLRVTADQAVADDPAATAGHDLERVRHGLGCSPVFCRMGELKLF
jgi:hypothetical protein